MRAIDVMARNVVTATPQTTVQDAAKLMINHRISGLPIVDGDGQLVGIVTEGDLLRRAETGTERQRSGWSEWFSPNSRLAAEYIKSHARRVAEIMSHDVVSVTELASLGEIADLMETNGSSAYRYCTTASSSGSLAAPISCVYWPAAQPLRPSMTKTA